MIYTQKTFTVSDVVKRVDTAASADLLKRIEQLTTTVDKRMQFFMHALLAEDKLNFRLISSSISPVTVLTNASDTLLFIVGTITYEVDGQRLLYAGLGNTREQAISASRRNTEKEIKKLKLGELRNKIYDFDIQAMPAWSALLDPTDADNAANYPFVAVAAIDYLPEKSIDA